MQPEAIDHSSLYVAPEIYRDEVFDRSVDVHSFGVMLYENDGGDTTIFFQVSG
ncbi:Integrin-linked protein kinase 1 [Orobanche gracilis]